MSDERTIAALERIAGAFEDLAAVAKNWFDREYPKREVKPASVGVAKYESPETVKPEELGEVLPEFEPIIGPREQAILDRQAKQAKRRA